jgi:hypothetical protein
MPAKAPDTRSVPYQRPSRQAQNTVDVVITRLRCDYRRRVVHDAALSVGARLLYVELDDDAGMKGICWPRQKTVAKSLGFHWRSCQEWLYELVKAGYVERIRTRTGNHYRLFWDAHQGVRPGCTPGCASDAHQGVRAFLITEPDKEPERLVAAPTGVSDASESAPAEIQGEPGVCACHGTGWLDYTDVKSDGTVVRKPVQCAYHYRPVEMQETIRESAPEKASC